MRRIRSFAPLAALVALNLGCGAALAQQSPVESRLTGLRLSGDQPIEIESDKLEVLENENKAIFTGNVNVTQGPTLLKAGAMTVFYARDGGSAATGSSKIDRLEVDGKVYVRSDQQVATGDRGTFDMKTEVLVLSGSEVVLSEGNNVLRGCKLTVQMKTGQAQVDGCTKGGGSGRVQMKLDPSSRQ
ncbi:MAG: LptA/OstA family protein [Pseudomonadota bacterium]|nr:LptA/OstA family protein [Pseudomonadota bacterium]